MIQKLSRIIFTIAGALCGAGISILITNIVKLVMEVDELTTMFSTGITIASILITALIFFLIAPPALKSLEKAAEELDHTLKDVPLRDLLCGTMGLILGLLIAYLISGLWRGLSMSIPLLGTVLSIMVYILFGYLGLYIGYRKSKDLAAIVRILSAGRTVNNKNTEGKAAKGKAAKKQNPKILDTSVIIDGRILDIMKTGFLEGNIVIPEFVLVELRHIADSADTLKRNRGRRGLDILNKIQEQYGIEIYNTEGKKAVAEQQEVDLKLLELASVMHGKVVTNDYNLNKVATLKGVEVLNINELANTLKPVVLPGEEMEIVPVKEGKEHNQALAYLDDGTMIVVEDGRLYIGESIEVIVTSVLQTAAGRMIFAKPKGF